MNQAAPVEGLPGAIHAAVEVTVGIGSMSEAGKVGLRSSDAGTLIEKIERARARPAGPKRGWFLPARRAARASGWPAISAA